MPDDLSSYVELKWSHNNVFRPEELKTMTIVFDVALKDLRRVKQFSEPDLTRVKRKLATLIMIYARVGERNPDMLRQLVVEDMSMSL